MLGLPFGSPHKALGVSINRRLVLSLHLLFGLT